MGRRELSDSFFAALEGVFAVLDGSVPAAPGNPCGACRECCTAQGLTRHAVSDLELDYLAEHAGEAGARAFAEYAARDRDPDGAYKHATCPFYQDGRCRVHRWRPFSCRAFGHYRMAGTRLPDGCVFTDLDQEFEFGRYFQTLPGSRELHQLKRDYAFLRRPGPVRLVSPGGDREVGEDDFAHLNPDDPLDRANKCLVLGDREGALAEARTALEELGGTPSVLYTLGTAFEVLSRPREALLVFREAVNLLPDCADFHYHVGYNLVQLRDFANGFQALERATELNPEHSLALGFMGYVLLLDGRRADAVPYLERAVAVDPDNAFFAARLAEARQAC